MWKFLSTKKFIGKNWKKRIEGKKQKKKTLKRKLRSCNCANKKKNKIELAATSAVAATTTTITTKKITAINLLLSNAQSNLSLLPLLSHTKKENQATKAIKLNSTWHHNNHMLIIGVIDCFRRQYNRCKKIIFKFPAKNYFNLEEI